MKSLSLDQICKMMRDYLVKSLREDGRFVYAVSAHSAEVSRNGGRYNMLRHAGAIYSLAMYADWAKDETIAETLLRSSRFMTESSMRPLADRNDILALWSFPEISGYQHPVKAKLGGAGLALIALCRAQKIDSNLTSISILRKLGEFILYMQKSDGSFHSLYLPMKGGRNSEFTSLYYPGEAALGLCMLYEIDPQEKWLMSAAKALAYLARQRRKLKLNEVLPDHWALIATGKVLKLHNYLGCAPISKERLQKHAVQICRKMLSEQIKTAENPKFVGGFVPDGRTTPTAIRLEGLLEALTYLPDDKPVLKKKIVKAVHHGMRFLVQGLIHEGKYCGGVTRALSPLNDPSFIALVGDLAQFNRRIDEIRIDYVQHAMSAIIQYINYFEGSEFIFEAKNFKCAQASERRMLDIVDSNERVDHARSDAPVGIS